MPALVSALNSVDLPTLGKPTMPHWRLMESFELVKRRAPRGSTLDARVAGFTTPGIHAHSGRPRRAGRKNRYGSATAGSAGRAGGSLQRSFRASHPLKRRIAHRIPKYPGGYNAHMTFHSRNFHAVVVGGGLVGKTAALALTQSGLRTALLATPAAAAPGADSFDSRIYALSSSSQALLERLRVWQALERDKLGPVLDMRVFGDAFAELHFSAFQAAVPQLAWIVESSLIERSLDAALRFQPNLTWIDSRAQGLTIHDDAAHLTLANGDTLEADLVVGADVAHSWVRRRRARRCSAGIIGKQVWSRTSSAKSRTARRRTNGSAMARSSRYCRCRGTTSRSCGPIKPNTPIPS